jgi:hypothetical protein
MKKIAFLVLALSLASCFKPSKTLKDLTIEAFEREHDKNLEMLSIICPTEGMECIQKYSLEYRTYNGRKYLYKIKYK